MVFSLAQPAPGMGFIHLSIKELNDKDRGRMLPPSASPKYLDIQVFDQEISFFDPSQAVSDVRILFIPNATVKIISPDSRYPWSEKISLLAKGCLQKLDFNKKKEACGLIEEFKRQLMIEEGSEYLMFPEDWVQLLESDLEVS